MAERILAEQSAETELETKLIAGELTAEVDELIKNWDKRPITAVLLDVSRNLLWRVERLERLVEALSVEGRTV